MSTSTQSIEIKQELLDTLDKLITHSQNEAKQLKDVLQTLKCSTRQPPAKPSPQQPTIKQEIIEIEDVDDPPATNSQSDEPLLGMDTLLRIKQELLKDLHKIHGKTSGAWDDISQKRSGPNSHPPAKRPRIELDLPPTIPPGSLPMSTPTAPNASSTPMVLVPIPASMIEELLKQNPGSPMPSSSILSSLPSTSTFSSSSAATSPPSVPSSSARSPSSTATPPAAPAATSRPTPLLSPSLTSSVLRFCERRAARDSVDVFHYLPADARISPFNTPPRATNYRKLLDDITKAKQSKETRPSKQQIKTIMMNERTVYSTYQAERLEDCFTRNEFLTKEDREILGRELQIHPDRIKVWYQNRRAKNRREEVLKQKIEAAARSKNSGL